MAGGFLTPEIEGAARVRSCCGTSIAELHHIAQLERGGNVFLEDVSFEPYYFSRENVWAHQLNPENQVEHVLNDGGQLWVLGLKTENPGSQGVNPSTILESRNGAKSEVLGGYQSTQGLKGNSINGSINCSQNGSSACPMYVTTESAAT